MKKTRFVAALLVALLMLFSLSPAAMAAVYWGQRGEEVRQVEAHHHPLDHRAQHDPAEQRDRETDPVRAGRGRHRIARVRGGHGHRALGEVDDPGGPPDQHQGQRERGVDGAAAEPVEGQEQETVHVRTPGRRGGVRRRRRASRRRGG